MMTMTRTLLLTFLSAWMLAPMGWTANLMLSEGKMALVADSGQSQYGALKIEKIDPKKRLLHYRWYLLPENIYDLAAPVVYSGTVETHHVRGKAIIAFGPFVLQWRGRGDNGVLSAVENLGSSPTYIASSGIHEATRIRDVRSGYNYQLAEGSKQEDRLGLADTFAGLPKAQLRLSISETVPASEDGYEIPKLQVSRIDQNSNAYKAGVRRGQELVAYNGVEIYSIGDFYSLIGQTKPGEQVTLTFLEKGTNKDITFEAEERRPPRGERTIPTIVPREGMTEEERQRLEKTQEVLDVLKESVEALGGVQFD